MGTALNLKVTAEGVETAPQLLVLQQLHCDHAQGYYFSPPMPADKATAFIKASVLSSAARLAAVP
jgi:EAL domain-containing protein (putative c-di-GMP-specific phosphodiesterase class I)